MTPYTPAQARELAATLEFSPFFRNPLLVGILYSLADQVEALQADAARHLEEMCLRIKAADDTASDYDYMLDSDDCIKVLRGTWQQKEPK